VAAPGCAITTAISKAVLDWPRTAAPENVSVFPCCVTSTVRPGAKPVPVTFKTWGFGLVRIGEGATDVTCGGSTVPITPDSALASMRLVKIVERVRMD
jgi:hypothetical protein